MSPTPQLMDLDPFSSGNMHFPCMAATHHLSAVFEEAGTSQLAQQNSRFADQLCFGIQSYTKLRYIGYVHLVNALSA